MKPPEDSTKRQVHAHSRTSLIVADGHERFVTAASLRLEQALLRKYRAKLSKAGVFQLIFIHYRIRRVVQRRVRKLVSPYALYSSRLHASCFMLHASCFMLHDRISFQTLSFQALP
jgi:hypothetical protein